MPLAVVAAHQIEDLVARGRRGVRLASVTGLVSAAPPPTEPCRAGIVLVGRSCSSTSRAPLPGPGSSRGTRRPFAGRPSGASQTGAQPSSSRALALSRLSRCASCGCGHVRRGRPGAGPHSSRKRSTTQRTGRSPPAPSGPKFQARQPSGRRRAGGPSCRYPDSGSSTCCQGRTASGLRTTIGSPAVRARTQSGNDPVRAPSRRRR